MIPVLEDPADAGGAVRGIIMLSILGIVEDLVDVLRIRSFQEDDLRPPFLQEGTDLGFPHMLPWSGNQNDVKEMTDISALVTQDNLCFPIPMRIAHLTCKMTDI